MKKTYRQFLAEKMVEWANAALVGQNEQRDNWDRFCKDVFPLLIFLIRRETAQRSKKKN